MTDPDEIFEQLQDLYGHQPEFLQAVRETFDDIGGVYRDDRAMRDANILARLVEPDRIISFRIDWEDDDGDLQVNRGYRVQFNNALGPYKGGVRFHPAVSPSVLKFLGYEQTFKNALTGLPMGGGKGGADFNPKDRSEREIMRFCNAFMTELVRHIGPDMDVPAGDIGVGSAEIGYLFGAYKRRSGKVNAALTGKPLSLGGSELRVEATGYGLIFFVENMLERMNDGVDGKRVVISGAGNVALHAAEKATDLGAKVIALSDSTGVLHKADGFTAADIDAVKETKQKRGASLKDALQAEWRDSGSIWELECDIALPCATQNELSAEDAKSLIDNGCRILAEGANMPCTADAAKALRECDIAYAPGKASNAGGVAVSGLEISQNRTRLPKSEDEICERLRDIMGDIHDTCVDYAGGGNSGAVDYVRGANIAGFRKLAQAMALQGAG